MSGIRRPASLRRHSAQAEEVLILSLKWPSYMVSQLSKEYVELLSPTQFCNKWSIFMLESFHVISVSILKEHPFVSGTALLILMRSRIGNFKNLIQKLKFKLNVQNEKDISYLKDLANTIQSDLDQLSPEYLNVLNPHMLDWTSKKRKLTGLNLPPKEFNVGLILKLLKKDELFHKKLKALNFFGQCFKREQP